MQRLLSRISRNVAYATKAMFSNELPVSSSSKCFFSAVSVGASVQKLPKLDIPGDFLKWASLGYCRTSRFATGFTPLQHKPLDSIVDFERVKDRSPEEIASIWDDVMFHIRWIILPALCLANVFLCVLMVLDLKQLGFDTTKKQGRIGAYYFSY